MEEEKRKKEMEMMIYQRKIKKIMVELFFDAYTYSGGDCEDVASLIHDIYRTLRYGLYDLRDKNIPYKMHGGWNSKLLDYIQKIAFQYINLGELGIVTSKMDW
jgi:hypothetical protein